MSEKTHSNLLEANNAVGSYLDDMLHEATSDAEVPVRDVQEFDHDLLPDMLLREKSPASEQSVTVMDIAIEKSNALVAEIETEFEEESEQAAELEVETETETETETPAALPASVFPLQFLMFRVAGNLLAVPLVEMQSVINWTDNLTQLPQEPDWVLGILKHRDRNVRVVDSVSIFQRGSDKSVTPEHILVVGDEKWAITCDQVDEVATLEYDDIQWNANADNTLTLGTVRDSLASLLNLSGIIHRLETGSV